MIELIWDIDGTLINTRGLGAAPFCEAFTDHTSFAATIDKKKLSGFTDFEIALSLMRDAGIREDIFLADKILNSFSTKLESILATEPPTILGDVLSTLEHIQTSESLTNSIGSGNFLKGAIVKLKSAGLFDFFKNSEFFVATTELWDRNAIIESAASKSTEYRKLVIGDSPRDISSARNSGLKVLSISTGQHSYNELLELAPDYILDSDWKLSDFLEIIDEFESDYPSL